MCASATLTFLRSSADFEGGEVGLSLVMSSIQPPLLFSPVLKTILFHHIHRVRFKSHPEVSLSDFFGGVDEAESGHEGSLTSS